MKELRGLSAEENELLMKAPVLVCLLIAGADGEIDRDEMKECALIANKYLTISESWKPFYLEAFTDFEDKLKIFIQHYPAKTIDRTTTISQELSALNPVLLKLPYDFAYMFHKTLLSLAERVALASGGVLGFGAIGSKEAKLVNLPMITPPQKIA